VLGSKRAVESGRSPEPNLWNEYSGHGVEDVHPLNQVGPVENGEVDGADGPLRNERAETSVRAGDALPQSEPVVHEQGESSVAVVEGTEPVGRADQAIRASTGSRSGGHAGLELHRRTVADGEDGLLPNRATHGGDERFFAAENAPVRGRIAASRRAVIVTEVDADGCAPVADHLQRHVRDDARTELGHDGLAVPGRGNPVQRLIARDVESIGAERVLTDRQSLQLEDRALTRGQ
jgi:hypothetical protein